MSEPELKTTGDQVAVEADELIDAMTEKAKPREQRVAGLENTALADFDRTYTQRPLSFFAVTEFMREAGKALDSATGGPDGANLQEIMGVAQARDMNSADVMMRIIIKLAEGAPDFLKKTFMLALVVPAYERDLVSEIWDSPRNEETGRGGLSHDDGFEILETFVAQNAKELRVFFAERMVKIGRSIQEIMQEDPDSSQEQESSAPSKRTRRSTPKR